MYRIGKSHKLAINGYELFGADGVAYQITPALVDVTGENEPMTSTAENGRTVRIDVQCDYDPAEPAQQALTAAFANNEYFTVNITDGGATVWSGVWVTANEPFTMRVLSMARSEPSTDIVTLNISLGQ